MTPSVVGILCALQSEARHLGPAVRRADLLWTLADGALLSVSGMGGKAASAGAQALVAAGATGLVSWGMAGGLDPSLAAGALLLPTEIVALDGASIETTRAWRERMSAAFTAPHPAVPGRLVTSARAVGSVADKAALFHETGAAAVDMESLAVAEVARSRNLPFVAVRVIVDTAGDALPKSVAAAADATGHLRLWRLLGALTLAPGDLVPLVRLAKRYRVAERSLAAVAAALPLALSPLLESERQARQVGS